MNIPTQIEYILRKLTSAGYDAYLVGGCVRDFLLGAAPSDYDITTSAEPAETMAVFDGDRVIPTGLKHGTVTVLYGGMSAEITTYRTETTYTDGRHPDKVQFSKHLSDDLCRRDFTVNAMAMDIDGNIVDLYGGREDLEKKIIRAVGVPHERFTEDALRILRAFRFASKLGFDIEQDTLEAAISLAPRLSLVSRERIFAELEKLLIGVSAAKIIETMIYGKVFDCIFNTPQISAEAVKYIDTLPCRADVRLAAFLLNDKNAEEHVKSLKTSTHFADSVLATVNCVLPESHSLPSLRRLVFASGKQAALDRALIDGDRDLFDKLSTLIETENCFAISDLDIKGSDIAALGISGRAIGDALTKLLFAVFDEKVTNAKADLIRYLKKVDNIKKV
ncbi:MAG: CCA tRNA nucleotidyltransferase [Clostridia bacterium]|nr:CCA tRNA nucleotidyltransferase [Clostridia bacterium]